MGVVEWHEAGVVALAVGPSAGPQGANRDKWFSMKGHSQLKVTHYLILHFFSHILNNPPVDILITVDPVLPYSVFP